MGIQPECAPTGRLTAPTAETICLSASPNNWYPKGVGSKGQEGIDAGGNIMRCRFKEFIILTASPAGGEELVKDFEDSEGELGIADYGLTQEQVTILLSGDRDLIRAELQREAEDNPACSKGKHKWSPYGLMTI